MERICCLDLEGVLVPEIWINVAEKTGIELLRRTTRDEPDYDKLMKFRLNILKKHKIKLKDIQKVIATLRPLTGAKVFLGQLRKRAQVIILSDTFYEFAGPLMKQLDYPVLFCNSLQVDRAGYICGYHLRQRNGKQKAVQALRNIGFFVSAAGDSYNDLTMLKAANRGILFRPPAQIVSQYTSLPVTGNHEQLLKQLLV